MKSRNKPKRQTKKPKKSEYKKTERGQKFNPWIYKYFDVSADLKKDGDDSR